MKKLTIIGGVNGVGKSSIYGVLNGMSKNGTDDLGVVIDTDKITGRFGGDKLKGGKEAVRLINECLENGESFAWETTLSGQKVLKTILAAREKGYKITLHYITVSSADECLSRIQNRVRKGGHDIPKEDVKRRFDKRFDDLLKILPYCDNAIFWDNENGFRLSKAFSKESSGIDDILANVPEWIKSLEKNGRERHE